MRRLTVVSVGLLLFVLAVAGVSAAPLSAAPVAVTPVAVPPVLTPDETLGRSIFFDTHLSLNQNQSCATCHAPEVGWTGPDSGINAEGAVYEGSVAGLYGSHKPPSSAYATQSPVLHDAAGLQHFVGGSFWDGRATGERLGSPAADQAQGPFLNPVEQALPDSACVVYRVCNPVAADAYPVAFDAVWGDSTCAIAWPDDVEDVCSTVNGAVQLSSTDRASSDHAFDQVALSIAAFEASAASNAFTSKYDYFLRGLVNFTPQEQMGLMLFTHRGTCAACHSLAAGANGTPALLTDYSYRNVGLPANPANPACATDAGYVDQGLGGFLADHPDYASGAAQHVGKQKVPSLRNADLRPSPDFVKAYGHNGYFKSLEAIVHFYNTRDVKPVCAADFDEAAALAANCWPASEVSENLSVITMHDMMTSMQGGMQGGMGRMGHMGGMMAGGMGGMGGMGMMGGMGHLGLNAAQEAAIVAFLRTLSDGYPLDTGAAH